MNLRVTRLRAVGGCGWVTVEIVMVAAAVALLSTPSYAQMTSDNSA